MILASGATRIYFLPLFFLKKIRIWLGPLNFSARLANLWKHARADQPSHNCVPGTILQEKEAKLPYILSTQQAAHQNLSFRNTVLRFLDCIHSTCYN